MIQAVVHVGHGLPCGSQQRDFSVFRRRGVHGDLPVEVSIGESEHTIDEVAVGGNQLIVVAADKLVPAEVGVAGFRHVDGQHVAQWVRVVAVQVIRDPQRPVLAGGKLAVFQAEKLIGRHVVGEVQAAVSHDHGRPDDAVEGDVVLADEVVSLCFGVLPEIFPSIGVAAAFRPFHGGGQVADDGLEPDVDALAFVTFHRERNAPGQIARYGAVFQAALQEAAGGIGYVGPPKLFAADPIQQGLLESGQAQEEVLGIAEVGRLVADAAPGFNEFYRVESVTTVVALVAPGAVVAAMGTRALNVTVGQETGAAGAMGQQHSVGVYVILFLKTFENVLHDPLVVLGVRRSEQVEGDPQTLPGIEELGVIAVQDHAGINAFLIGPYRNGGSVGIRAGYHQHFVALHAMVTGKNIGGQIAAGDMPHVQGAVGVGPGDANENSLRQGYPSSKLTAAGSPVILA